MEIPLDWDQMMLSQMVHLFLQHICGLLQTETHMDMEEGSGSTEEAEVLPSGWVVYHKVLYHSHHVQILCTSNLQHLALLE